MTLEEEYRLSFYQQVAEIDPEHNVVLVQHIGNQRFFVKKTLDVYEESVFLYLKEHYIPGIPRVIEAVRDEDRLIVIEEYVSGRSLKEILDEEGALSEAETRRILMNLTETLRLLHTQEPPIIHRDIKPSNVILKEDGSVMLLDMNAAKWYHNDAVQDTRLIGTFRYAAPEQYGFGQSGPETDIYSLGVLANVMLTGYYPQEQLSGGVMGEIIERCTKMDPSERFRSDEALYKALKDIDDAEKTEDKLTGKPSENSRGQGKRYEPISRTESPEVQDDQHENSWKRFLFPGLTSKKRAVRGWSLAGYLFLILISCVQKVESENRLIVWLNRLCCLLVFLIPILFSFNYLHILDRLRITRIRNRVLRILVIAAVDFLIALMLVVILDFLELWIK